MNKMNALGFLHIVHGQRIHSCPTSFAGRNEEWAMLGQLVNIETRGQHASSQSSRDELSMSANCPFNFVQSDCATVYDKLKITFVASAGLFKPCRNPTSNK